MIADLWRRRDGRLKFPTHDYVVSESNWLTKMPFVVDAPGPGGGKGYCVAAEVVDDLQRVAATDARSRRNRAHRAAAAVLSSRFAKIEG
jgi:hypothetical protein